MRRLVADFEKIGLEIEWHTVGAPRPVAPAIGLAAYRIIQEALTNAHRHGCGHRATRRLDYGRDALCIEVPNIASVSGLSAAPMHAAYGAAKAGLMAYDIDPDGPVGARRGHGTVGMRERVTAAGGTIEIGPTAGGRFRVHATLPTEQAER